MDNNLFSQYYSNDVSRYEDKEKFRLRILKYLEDFVNHNFPENINLECRSRMGLNIDYINTPSIKKADLRRYEVEKLFLQKKITDILDFIGVCYYALKPHEFSNPHLEESLKKFIHKVNEIFQEESMCYEMHEDGKVRYYPDEEFQQAVKSTLLILNDSRYQNNLIAFNDTLDDFYKNRNTESPLRIPLNSITHSAPNRSLIPL